MRWIEVQDQPPTQQDADVQGCVIVWHIYNGVMVMKWHLVAKHSTVTHWRHMPDPPQGCRQ